MTEVQRLFLVQAGSVFDVFKLLNAERTVHPCHALHYLQMATELLGKAGAWRNPPVGKSHKALVPFLRNLTTNSKAQNSMGHRGQNSNWTNKIRKIIAIAEQLQKLAPALAGEGPNVEYPWPPAAPTTAPVEFAFPISADLSDTSDGRAMLAFLQRLFDAAEEYI